MAEKKKYANTNVRRSSEENDFERISHSHMNIPESAINHDESYINSHENNRIDGT